MEKNIPIGIYLNPGNDKFATSLRSEIYVDKSGLISFLNKKLGTEQKYLCVSRPRRFGKTMAGNMIAAYYSKASDSTEMFSGLKIAHDKTFKAHLNKHNVFFINIQNFWSDTGDIEKMKVLLQKSLLWDLKQQYPQVSCFDETNLTRTLRDVFAQTKQGFVFIVDEWDCLFRESENNPELWKAYLDFLRNLFKDAEYTELVYMTGILPIKKYGSHSALNMFTEYSMTDPMELAEFVGFTEDEVKDLCKKYAVDFTETKHWYDGYRFPEVGSIYSPKSVVDCMLHKSFSNYWTKTETYEALKIYIQMDFDGGVKQAVIKMLAGESVKIDTHSFQNDMTTFETKDDVLTLLIHVGYLGYKKEVNEIFIPNSEVASEFVTSISVANWSEIVKTLNESEQLLQNTWQKNANAVAEAIDSAHIDSASILKYNDENSLACVISLAYYNARKYYTIFRELPAGKGFADIVFLPRRGQADKPAMVVELKWDKAAQSALEQIKEKKYCTALKDYRGKLLLVGINYNKETKKHSCKIEEYVTALPPNA